MRISDWSSDVCSSDLVTALLKTMGSLSPEERQTRGPAIHGLREAVTNALADRKNALELAALEARLASEKTDVTLPVSTGAPGSLHPISQGMAHLAATFPALGFSLPTGPAPDVHLP